MPARANQVEVTELIKDVRQARQYSPEPVSDEQLDELLEIVRWTGSGGNMQPWHFIVINDQEKLKQISRLRSRINWIAEAPLAIAIVLDGTHPLLELYDEGRVTERLLIGACAMGLGAGIAWYGTDEHEAQAKQILGIPAELTTHSLVVIGRPTALGDPRPEPVPGGRRPLTEIVSYNRMSDPIDG